MAPKLTYAASVNRLLVAVAAFLAPLVVIPAAPAAQAAPAADHPRVLSRLHATHGSNAAIVNERGAEVLLRGVNVNQLGEYFQANPDLAPTVPISKDDFRDIAALGFNSVRLIVTWSTLEPTPGAYDEAYVDEIRQAVDWAASYGLYTVLDMHQDAYGIAVDTPDDVTCTGGTHPNNGWDGAPEWATITDGASTCTPGERELAPAVKHAWQNFYDDTDGVQTHLVQVWGKLAEDFAKSSAVAGFDLLNEPGIGLATDNHVDLGTFYGRAIQAIRSGERAGGGFSHPVFFEPSVMWSALGSWTTPEPGFTKDRNIVFAPHIYAESLSSNSIDAGFAAAAGTAAGYGVTVWGGEWGFWPAHPVEASDKIERYAAAEDAAAYGGAWWDWKQACGDPHVAHAPDGVPEPVSGSLNRYSCPDQTNLGIDPAFGDVLSRPVPRAVPGRITRLTSDGRTGDLDLSGKLTGDAQRCGLRVFVPARFADLKVRVDGIRNVQRRELPNGNVVLRGCVSDRYRLQIG